MASTNQVPLDPSSSIEIVWDFEMWKCFLLNVAWGSLLKLVCRSLKGLRWPWSYWPWGGPALLTSDRGFDAVSLKGTGRLTGNTPRWWQQTRMVK